MTHYRRPTVADVSIERMGDVDTRGDTYLEPVPRAAQSDGLTSQESRGTFQT